MQISSDKYKKVLIFNPSFIGDAILTTPLINAVRALIPEATIDFCVRPESAPLFEGLPNLNIIKFDKRGEYKGLAGLLKFVKLLKGYDIVITPHKSTRSILALFLARIPVRIGFRQSALSMLLTGKVNRRLTLHEVERNLSLLSLITDNYSLTVAKTLGGTPVTIYDEKFGKVAGEFMQNASEGRKIIGLNPGSTWATKRMPVEHFAKVAQLLYDKGYALAIFGGPADVEVTDKLKSLLPMEFFDYANTVEFRQIPALIKNIDLLITNDSAPLHIAVSQNTPTVAIFGATVPTLGFSPYDNVSVICENNELSCRPCGLHGGNSCPEGHFKCMIDLKPEEIVAATERILNG
ncbi:MAG: lipopolysaccharide heptosyltransferase II [Deferribacteraceae bacterium]|jgi:heptosyltransferase-2|nr:lipopolysaccharide heptosyltransferase II [Deferribacteraceae bacterium]